MTRKDTILIATVINAGLLAVLFTTAVIYDTEGSHDQMEFALPLAENKMPPIDAEPNLIAAVSPRDEVDNFLKYYTAPASQPIVVQTEPEVYIPQAGSYLPKMAEHHDAKLISDTGVQQQPSKEQFIEVIVKKGDVLEKIARANKSSVGAIKRANQIDGERLSIGQVLKVPVKQNGSSFVVSTPSAPLSSASTIALQGEPLKAEQKPEVKKPQKVAEPVTKEPEVVYYVIKSGDNPWKIAKQYGVKYDEILRLNQLDEDKARNLKIGDRIRVK